MFQIEWNAERVGARFIAPNGAGWGQCGTSDTISPPPGPVGRDKSGPYALL